MYILAGKETVDPDAEFNRTDTENEDTDIDIPLEDTIENDPNNIVSDITVIDFSPFYYI